MSQLAYYRKTKITFIVAKYINSDCTSVLRDLNLRPIVLIKKEHEMLTLCFLQEPHIGNNMVHSKNKGLSKHSYFVSGSNSTSSLVEKSHVLLSTPWPEN
jgi:hypothetical protein